MTTVRDLITGNYLQIGDCLVWTRKGLQTQHQAIVQANGTLKTDDGTVHKSPSGAAKHLAQRPVDGWLAWKLEGTNESLGDLRTKFAARS
jgi:hypothetical protein